MNRAIAIADPQLDMPVTQSHSRRVLLDMNVQIRQSFFENGEAEFLACTAGRPFHDADDTLRIELHLHIQIAGCQLDAVLDALNSRRRRSCR